MAGGPRPGLCPVARKVNVVTRRALDSGVACA